MRLIPTVGPILALLLLLPQESAGNIAVIRTLISEIHAPGSAQGGKHGALTLAWGNEGARPLLRTVYVMPYSKMTAPGKDGRVAISFKDLKPGQTVVTEMSANRAGDTSWKLDALHMLDLAKPADPALVKQLTGRGGFVGPIAEVREPDPDRKGDVGRLVVNRDKDMLTFHITPDTAIIRQTADGKQFAIKFSELSCGTEVAVSFPDTLVSGNPPHVPAAEVILLRGNP